MPRKDEVRGTSEKEATPPCSFHAANLIHPISVSTPHPASASSSYPSLTILGQPFFHLIPSLIAPDNTAVNQDRCLAAEVLYVVHDLLGSWALQGLSNTLYAIKLHDGADGVWAIGVELADGVGFEAMVFPVLHGERHVCLDVVLLVEGGAFLARVEDDSVGARHDDVYFRVLEELFML
jgi:hypothetical protein